MTISLLQEKLSAQRLPRLAQADYRPGKLTCRSEALHHCCTLYNLHSQPWNDMYLWHCAAYVSNYCDKLQPTECVTARRSILLFFTECCYTASCVVVFQRVLASVMSALIIMVGNIVTAAGDDYGCLI